MLTAKDKMFADDSEDTTSSEKVSAVDVLDEFIVKILRDKIVIDDIQIKEGVPTMNAMGCIEFKGPKTLELQYYES